MSIIKRTGIISRDPELRFTMSRLAVCNFIITEENEAEHRVVCFAEIAEKAAELNHGDKVTISGYFKRREWKDRDGHARGIIELTAKKIEKIT